jgi:hypothetical protein
MMRWLALLLFLSTSAFAGAPTTTDNDDSCDISMLPAATLLLPYFEVDFRSPATTARTTLFTIQNTTAMPQIARVTLWTDWSYPMLTFNIFLTGYDVQGINLYDVFARGVVAPAPGMPGGTSNKTPPGERSLDQNPNFLPDAAVTCSSNPGPLSSALMADLQAVFSTGRISAPGCAAATAGSPHANAIGYATIDVMANCDTETPIGAHYFAEILYDNVLTGDSQDISPNPATGNYASGNPLVHIRAVPEGGAAGQSFPTTLPFTFYDLHTAGMPRTVDRRQPLPSAFMPRFINGGTGAFNTNLKIWREAFAAPATCPTSYRSNSNLQIAEVVRFDEHENPTVISPYCGGIPECPPGRPGTATVLALSAANTTVLPPMSTSGDVGGWLFLNLNNGGSTAYSAQRNFSLGTTTRGARQSQEWVVTSMFAEGRYAVEMDALAVGNGCSPAPGLSSMTPIGPAPNPNP